MVLRGGNAGDAFAALVEFAVGLVPIGMTGFDDGEGLGGGTGTLTLLVWSLF